jgi:hypothetical protein
MKKFLLAILAMFALASAARANEFTFAQAGVKITVPNGYTLLQRSEVDQLYPPTRGPGFVIGNAARSVTISYDLKPFDLASLNLAQALKPFEQVFEKRVPSLVWKQRNLLEHEKQQWLQLEFLSRDRNADYYNIMLITPVKDQMLVLNLNASAADFPTAEAELRAVMKSIVLNVVVPEPVAAPAAKKPAPAKKKEKAAG